MPLRHLLLSALGALSLYGCQLGSGTNPEGADATARATINRDSVTLYADDGQAHQYSLDFYVLYREDDPEMQLRPANLDHTPYNVPTWLAVDRSKADLETVERDAATAGDGFDASILEGSAEARTANYFASGRVIAVMPDSVVRVGNTVHLSFADRDEFSLKAKLTLDSAYPSLSFTLQPKEGGFFSVGFMGAPAFPAERTEEIWQPLIWQEKSFPDRSYLTLAYRAPLPTTLVRAKGVNYGVVADPKEFPFDPLPVADNSRFGVALRNPNGDAQPMLFSPVLGGFESEMQPGERYSFTSHLVAEKADSITGTYESIARQLYDFRDHRKNGIASLNTTFQNIVDYSLTDYAWFEKELKGSAYSTDVPGAVKNVTSLNALELALVTDNREMFEDRAYPTLEYMLSREKFLFSLDPEQKIQNPSRNMFGPIAPISELSALHNILGGANDFFIKLAEDEYNSTRIRNLDVKENGDTWWNSLWLYKASGDETYLNRAVEGADAYLASRVEKGASEPAGFFWTQFTPRFIELSELYEITGEQRYLDAAREVARHYTMFTWMAPKIPDQKVLVNKDGKAPIYWYLKSKGHQQMYIDEEAVDAWLLSEIGLTAESSGTSSGHRAIFMANYAPWLLRIGYYADDTFLQEVAKAAIIGRYENFPGYHINTARTSIYMKESYPMHPFKELSVNSFHFNHILPMASMLLDYLVTDVFVRTDGQVNFPSEYIEGYAYLQNKFYGHAPGAFYGEEGVNLWMPKGLLAIDDIELNYISGFKDNALYLAFTNQSDQIVSARVQLNDALVDTADSLSVTRWRENRLVGTDSVSGDALKVQVAPNGVTVVKVDGATAKTAFRQNFTGQPEIAQNDYQELDVGNARAMLIHLGGYGERAYIYLRDDDNKVASATLRYTDTQGRERSVTDDEFPYEFTVELPPEASGLTFELETRGVDGRVRQSDPVTLGH